MNENNAGKHLFLITMKNCNDKTNDKVFSEGELVLFKTGHHPPSLKRRAVRPYEAH